MLLRLAIYLLSALACLPLVVVLSSLWSIDPEIWTHLRHYVLPDLVRNTVYLGLGTLSLTVLLGVGLAWLTAMYQFPAANYFAWALMLPLAIPTYVLAFVQSGLFDYGGALRQFARDVGFESYLPEMRSVSGAIWVMSLAFYPYVYLLAQKCLFNHGQSCAWKQAKVWVCRVNKVFGVWPYRWPDRGLPQVRLLVLMETLADFGAVAVLNVDTFTTAIYKSWFSLFSLDTASQLASLLVVIAFGLMLIEQVVRGARRYTATGRHSQHDAVALTGWRAIAASLACASVLAIAFVIPLVQLMVWAYQSRQDLDSRYWGFVGHSVTLSALAALLVVGVALLLAYGKRRLPQAHISLMVKAASLGYAIPGAVLAVGIFVLIAGLDNYLIEQFALSQSAIFKGTLVVMLLAYLVRFLAVGLQPTQTALERISHNQELAARNLGYTGWRLLRVIHIPMMRGGLLTALLLVFVDVMKELPITLMTRPFGWDTLAVRIFEMTSEGQWQQAALPAVLLVLVGLVPVWLITRSNQT
jgi:iron(III) transport system permease protein